MSEPIIGADDPRRPEVVALLDAHLAFTAQHSPPEHTHALDGDRLAGDRVAFFSACEDGAVLAIGALQRLDEHHGELKSMHTAAHARGRGLGRAMLDHLVAEARRRGYRRVSLETGTPEVFAPARQMYAGAGFVACEPFGRYRSSEHNTFMTLELTPPDGVTSAPDP